MRVNAFRFPSILVLVVAPCLVGCGGGPIVARSPEALYALAKEQMANANYQPASDTLAKILKESPESEFAARAQVLRLALLGGMARGYREMGEAYREGYEKAGAAPYATEMRAIAMDYFGRARGRSIEMVEGLDRFLRQPPAGPLQLDFPLPEVMGAESLTFQKVRAGRQVTEEEQAAAEQEKIRRGLAVVMAELLSAGRDIPQARAHYPGESRLELPVVYVGLAEEIVEASSVYQREALNDPRMLRLYHERAGTVAERAASLALRGGDTRLRQQAEKLQQQCQKALAAR